MSDINEVIRNKKANLAFQYAIELETSVQKIVNTRAIAALNNSAFCSSNKRISCKQL